VSPTPTYHEEPPRSNLMIALVAGAIIALVAANIYLYIQVDNVRSDVHAQMTKMHDSIMAEVTSLRDSSSVTSASQQKHLDTLKEELESARNQARTLSSQAKAEAEARAEQLAKELAAEQARTTQQVRSEISGVKQTADTANAKLADVSTDVGNVKTDVASTKSELQKTIADLKSVRGDLGVQSGLVATNANELAALRRLGERNYVEFKLPKGKQFQRVADITLKLRDTNTKKNMYSVDVMADDKLTEKKNKNLNEPVQFYTTKGGHIPYEIVVNQVQKDMIVGYLSTPKEPAGR
jgi:chromosome segregation ATPase